MGILDRIKKDRKESIEEWNEMDGGQKIKRVVIIIGIIVVVAALQYFTNTEKVAPSSLAKNSDGKTPAEAPVVSQMVGASNQAEWQVGKEYYFEKKGTCQNSEQTVCLDVPNYEKACKSARGVTKGALVTLANDLEVRNGNKKYGDLVRGGSMSASGIMWDNSAQRCIFTAEFSGLYSGTSSRETISGYIWLFIVPNGSNQLLGQGISYGG